ncbi:glycoside hydrolase family 99 protein [uncultured Kordia sp.]|uniref:glycoside hydrolase family 99 protein n=1 Tax=uncultured Kordia sp. TaxID=507699 RepID=UPI00262C4874|nr:glycoside hydrolase family 99 protein [uncultured Kordia sp.]
MKTNHQLYILSFLLILTFSCKEKLEKKVSVSKKIHTFYYNWYGSPEYDGKYLHWNHEILPHWSDTTWNNAGSFKGGNDIGANYYPALGNYSSNDPKVINEHFKLMQQAGIGVCVMSWWGKNGFEDKSIPTYLDIAAKYGIQLAFHIEPFYKSVAELKAQLHYIHEQYGKHSAVYKTNGKPLYYMYDSYKLDASEWAKLLKPNGELSIRNTELDATFIGLWVHENEGDFFTTGGFDGFYTYFASTGFVYGSTPKNWKQLADFAQKNKLLFIPSVGPGYIDTRIRPWNANNTKSREQGSYYEHMFESAAKLNPNYISITSFNEWHEGTQIEPAVPKTIPNYTYEDYGKNVDSLFYIRKTRELIEKYVH